MSLIKTRNPNPFPIGIKFGFLKYGGDCWTRTSDLLRVKNCVTSGAGGHSRYVPHRHRPFAPPQGLKLYTATAVYSLKKPDT